MKTNTLGVVFYDTTKKPLSEKIINACDVYQQRFGTAATHVFVNSADLATDVAGVNDLRESLIIDAPTATTGGFVQQPNNVWAGVIVEA